MLYGILFLLINIEYISFYYVFWGKRANIKYDWKMLVTLCISVLLLVLSIGIGNLDILCVPAIISGVLINSQIYRLRVSETIKLALVSFPLLSILESIFEFILMYGVKLDPEYVNIVYTVVVVAIIWIYYWTIGRRIDKDAFLLPGKMSLVVAAALFAIEAMISYFTFDLVSLQRIWELIIKEKHNVLTGTNWMRIFGRKRWNFRRLQRKKSRREIIFFRK